MIILAVLAAAMIGATIRVLPGPGLVSNYWIWLVALGGELAVLVFSLREAYTIDA